MALWHLVTAQTRGMKHKPSTPKSPANQPSLSGPHSAPLTSASGSSGAGNTTRENNQSNQKCDSAHTRDLAETQQVQGMILPSQPREGKEVVARGPGAGKEKFKLFPENSEVTSPLSLEEQKEQRNAFFPFTRTSHFHCPLMLKIQPLLCSQVPRPISAIAQLAMPPPRTFLTFQQVTGMRKFAAGLKNRLLTQALLFTPL